MATKRLKVNDAAWLLAERKHIPQQVAILALCTPPPDAPRTFLRDLVARWREHTTFAPPFNYKLLGGPVKRWQQLDDADIDLDYHLRHSALPEPGGERELGVLISRLHSRPLDRTYPLWEAHVIEGLEGGRFALYVKVHHSQIDGVGGIRLFERVFSADPAARDLAPPWQVGVGRARPSLLPGAEQPPKPSREPGSVLSAVGQGYRDTVRGTDDERAAMFRAPKTILNGRVHGPRRFATQHYELDRIKRVAKAAGVTANDVYLAVCSGALRRYLSEEDSLPERSLTTLVPVSVRPKDDAAVGNAISFLAAKLATDVADPRERLAVISRSVELGKARIQDLPKAAMDNYTTLLMTPVIAQAVLGVGGYGAPSANVVISNVPGPSEPLYVDGARIDQVYPVSLIYHGQALNITAVSYAGQFNIGYTGCRDSLPHMQHVAVYSGEALAELEGAVGL
jgi:diacylglycerol O-acyltransferase